MSEARFALTFDAEHPDRPHHGEGNPERILDVLSAAGVRTTFFVQGRWALANPRIARRIADDGHVVGHHSRYHARMSYLSDDGIRADVEEGQSDIVAATGADPRPWFRCPFGDGYDDPRVLGILAGLGYRNVHWNVEPKDWDPSVTAAEVVEAAVNGTLAHGDVAVILLHSWPDPTPVALPSILRRLAIAGATSVRLDEMESAP